MTPTERKALRDAAALVRLWYPDKPQAEQADVLQGIVARKVADRLEQWANGEVVNG